MGNDLLGLSGVGCVAAMPLVRVTVASPDMGGLVFVLSRSMLFSFFVCAYNGSRQALDGILGFSLHLVGSIVDVLEDQSEILCCKGLLLGAVGK
jgi:hypothetical protein